MHPIQRRRRHVLTCWLAMAIACMYWYPAHAQESPWFQIHGGVGLSTDVLQRSGGPNLGYPGTIHRASINATITLFDQISLPFDAYITSLGSGYSQPFNQFGIHPRFGNWLQLHAGYFNQPMSDLTFGDVRLLGAGAVFTPGQFNAKAIYGTALQAREPNPAMGFSGDYFRQVMGVSIGYKDSTDGASVNILYARDDKNSITPNSSTRPPAENMVTSIAFTSSPWTALSFNGEFGVSLYTADVRASLIDSSDANSLASSLVTYNLTTTADVAGRLGATFTFSPDLSLRALASWTGPGFISLGYVQMLNDLFDVTLSPSLRLFDGDVFVTGSIGQRTNNLRNIRLSTTTQLIGSANITVIATQHLSMDASYANFGMRSSSINDTLRISNISQFLSFSPRYTFDEFGATNTVSLNISIQQSEDASQFLPAPITNDNLSLGANYMLTFPSALSLITSINRYRGVSNGITTDVVTASQTGNLPLFDRVLTLGATAGVNIVQSSANTTQIFGRLSANYSLDDYGGFSLVLATNRFDYTATGSLSYSEFSGSLQYSVSI